MVDHVILLDKLHAYGLDNTSLSWFQSYLSDRRQFISMSEKESTRSIIPHGVPQGSILGPLLLSCSLTTFRYMLVLLILISDQY